MTDYTFSEQIVSDLHKDARGFRPRDIGGISGVSAQTLRSKPCGTLFV